MSKWSSVKSSLRRSPYQTFAAFVLTTLTFFVVSICTLLVAGAHNLLTYVESRPQVTAFFKDTTQELDILALESQIQSMGIAFETKYVSKNEALSIYRSQNQGNPLLLEMVTADILPSSLEVSAKSVKNLETLAGIFKDNKLVEEVVYQKDVVDILQKWVNGVRIGGIAFSSLLLFASLVTIILILGMRVSLRKNEINTLFLLGATSWYVRAPFILEGWLYGVVGAFFGWGATYILLLYLTPYLLTFFAGTNLFPVPPLFMLAVFGAEFLLGSLLGLVASSTATKRYRK